MSCETLGHEFKLEDGKACATLYNSFVFTAVTNCSVPAHQSLAFCSCPVALSSQSESAVVKTKLQNVFRFRDCHLLRAEHGCFSYDGSQLSELAFKSKSGVTPLDFAKRWLEAMVELFAPTTTMDDWTKALIGFWLARTRMWNAKGYKDCNEAKEEWFKKEYDMSDNIKFSHKGVSDLVDLSPEMMLMFHDITMGPGGHQSMVSLYQLTKLEKGLAFKIAKFDICHEECPVAANYWEYHLISYMKGAAQKYGFGDLDVSSIRLGTVAEFRARYELAPSPSASTTERDILFILQE